MYADDCLIYTIGNTWETMVPRIQDGFDSFQAWCKKNCLKLNIRKGPSINYVRIFSQFLDPPPPLLHTVRI